MIELNSKIIIIIIHIERVIIIITFYRSVSNSSQPIWFAPLTCSESETCLASCDTTCPVSATDSCTHDQDVILTCCKLLYTILLLLF